VTDDSQFDEGSSDEDEDNFDEEKVFQNLMTRLEELKIEKSELLGTFGHIRSRHSVITYK
jgi:hypothetical protein